MHLDNGGWLEFCQNCPPSALEKSSTPSVKILQIFRMCQTYDALADTEFSRLCNTGAKIFKAVKGVEIGEKSSKSPPPL